MAWKNDGIHYEADPRHAEINIRDLGLQNCSDVVTPCEREDLGKVGSNLKAKDAEIVVNLFSFFERGGLEMALDVAGFKISTVAIRRKASEAIDGRERR